jgi:O-antigen ligase
VGFKNWGVADKQMFDGTGGLSHNIFIECMSELGYSGLIAFILLIFFTVKNNFKTIRVARNEEMRFIENLARALNVSLVGYLVAGFFVTVLFYPYFWVNLAMTVSLNNIVKKRNLAF